MSDSSSRSVTSWKCISPCARACVLCIYIYIHTYIHTYTHMCIHEFKRPQEYMQKTHILKHTSVCDCKMTSRASAGHDRIVTAQTLRSRHHQGQCLESRVWGGSLEPAVCRGIQWPCQARCTCTLQWHAGRGMRVRMCVACTYVLCVCMCVACTYVLCVCMCVACTYVLCVCMCVACTYVLCVCMCVACTYVLCVCMCVACTYVLCVCMCVAFTYMLCVCMWDTLCRCVCVVIHVCCAQKIAAHL